MQLAPFADYDLSASSPGSSGTMGGETQDTGWADQRVTKLERVIAPHPLQKPD